MTKKVLLDHLNAAISILTDIRRELESEEDGDIRNPEAFGLPVTVLALRGTQRNKVLAILALHDIHTIGDLVNVGRATVAKWQGITAKHLSVLQTELFAEYDIKF